MLTRFWHELFANPNGSSALIRRLLEEHGSSHWRRYAVSLAMMAVGAGCTAGMAFIIGPGIDQAYTERHFAGVAHVGMVLIVLFAVKGLATYGQTVTMGASGRKNR